MINHTFLNYSFFRTLKFLNGMYWQKNQLKAMNKIAWKVKLLIISQALILLQLHILRLCYLYLQTCRYKKVYRLYLKFHPSPVRQWRKFPNYISLQILYDYFQRYNTSLTNEQEDIDKSGAVVMLQPMMWGLIPPWHR